MKMQVTSKTINVQAKAEYNHDVHYRFQSVSMQYAKYRSKPKRITQNPNMLVAKMQTSNVHGFVLHFWYATKRFKQPTT